MKNMIWLLAAAMLLLAAPLSAQDEKPAEDKAETEQAETQTEEPAAEESEDQRNTRAISIADLKAADAALTKERETIAKRQRRMEMLMEDIKNQEEALAAKESDLEGKFNQLEEDELNFNVPLSP